MSTPRIQLEHTRRAREQDFPPCPSCGARRGEPCLNPKGETFRPHAARLLEMRAELVRRA
jgi:hypothetical protein